MLYTQRETAAKLGVAKVDASELGASGLLGPVQLVGHTTAYNSTVIDALAAREYVEPGHPAAYVVRVRAKEKPNDQRAFMGYATSYGTRNDEKTRRDALRCWWPVRDPGQYDDHLLVASLAGFVVAVYRITGFKPHPIDTRIAFEVQEIPRHDKKHPDTIDAAWFDNHRVERWRGALSGPYVAGNNPGAKQ